MYVYTYIHIHRHIYVYMLYVVNYSHVVLDAGTSTIDTALNVGFALLESEEGTTWGDSAC